MPTIIVAESTLVVLDYETTGSLRGFVNEPWQVGMVTLRMGRVDPGSMFESLLRVDRNRPFNPHAPGRHARLRDEIAAAPSPEELWPTIASRLQHQPLCAHNVATEKKMLRMMAPMHRFGPWLDTLRIARRAWPKRDSYALEELVSSLGLKARTEALCPGRSAHDALYDAVAAAVMLEYLLTQPGWGKVSFAELASL